MDGGHIALNVYMGNELDSCNSCNHTATFNEEFLMNSFVHKNSLLKQKTHLPVQAPAGRQLLASCVTATTAASLATAPVGSPAA